MAVQPPPDSVVDWEAVDEEIKSVPSEYREPRFYPLKHVVEVFSSADPQGLTQEVRAVGACACTPALDSGRGGRR